MSALKAHERDTVRRINCALRDANRAAAANRLWQRRIAAELQSGPATRYELSIEVCGAKPNGFQRDAIGAALTSLLKSGEIVERPMFEASGRAVRVEPVMVLELAR